MEKHKPVICTVIYRLLVVFGCPLTWKKARGKVEAQRFKREEARGWMKDITLSAGASKGFVGEEDDWTNLDAMQAKK